MSSSEFVNVISCSRASICQQPSTHLDKINITNASFARRKISTKVQILELRKDTKQLRRENSKSHQVHQLDFITIINVFASNVLTMAKG